jgi:parallel beta helix pectate lyase-like protein
MIESIPMGRNARRVTLSFLLLCLLGASASCTQAANACGVLQGQVNKATNASFALAECLHRLPAGAKLPLPPGVYRLSTPLLIDRTMTITTAGIGAGDPGCAQLAPGRCATLLVDTSRWVKVRTMPVEVQADGVTFDHLVVRGAGATPDRRSACSGQAWRPGSGGIRVSGSSFTLRKSVIRDFTCYSALEVTAAAKSPTLEFNVIGPNGQHLANLWSDGVTVHDSDHANVTGNLFVDNTDVQLIFGGCRACIIENNRFRHTGAFSSGSFAELMLQAWPNTSGDYAGTVVRGNSIDCGGQRRCGYGIMIGSAPWYPGRMSGGVIAGNQVSNAMIGINIDALSGPVEVEHNVVRSSGGRFSSHCGARDWPAVNVGPTSRRYLKGVPAQAEQGSVNTAGCLLNRPRDAR